MATNTIKLKIPPQDLPQFSHFRADREGASNWLATLPKDDTEDCARQLTAALEELTQYPLAPELRYDVASVMLPTIDRVITDLSRQFYNLPPVIPTEALQKIERADQLCTLTGTLFIIVALETIRNPSAVRHTAPAQLACVSLFRARALLSRTGTAKLEVVPAPAYKRVAYPAPALRAGRKSAACAPPDSEPSETGQTITRAYLQALLLACCRPNQLRQSDLNALFHSLNSWSEAIALRGEPGDSAIYLVDLQSDLPPLHRSLFPDDATSDRRYIDTSHLLEKLEALRQCCDRIRH